MSTHPSLPTEKSALRFGHLLWSLGPFFLALLGLGVIYASIADRVHIGPPWLMLGLIVILLPILTLAIFVEHLPLSRAVGMILLGLITGAEVVSTTILVLSLLVQAGQMSQVPHADALLLLRDAALLWLANILTFHCIEGRFRGVNLIKPTRWVHPGASVTPPIHFREEARGRSRSRHTITSVDLNDVLAAARASHCLTSSKYVVQIWYSDPLGVVAWSRGFSRLKP